MQKGCPSYRLAINYKVAHVVHYNLHGYSVLIIDPHSVLPQLRVAIYRVGYSLSSILHVYICIHV